MLRKCSLFTRMADTNPKESRTADPFAWRAKPFVATAFGDLTRAAADVFGVPMSSITVLDQNGRGLQIRVGMPTGGIAGASAFGTLALETPNELTVIEDTRLDPRFADSSLAKSALRFYAAAPLILSTGESVGILCVQDTEPHQVDPQRLQQLKFMADQVVATLEARETAGSFRRRRKKSSG